MLPWSRDRSDPRPAAAQRRPTYPAPRGREVVRVRFLRPQDAGRALQAALRALRLRARLLRSMNSRRLLMSRCCTTTLLASPFNAK